MPENEISNIGISKVYRQKIMEHLQFAYANDHLDEREFEKRIELATKSDSRKTLDKLIEDLPAIDTKQFSEKQTAFNVQTLPENETLVGFFSSINRKGKWQPAKKTRIIAIMGGVDLDFTEVNLPPEGIEIEVFCLMGVIEIRIPPGINVDAQPFAIMGSVDRDGIGYLEKAPLIKIRGFVLMGGVDIKPPRKNIFKKIFKKIFLE